MKILLVEDDLQLQESLSMALKLKNHTVDCLETMKDALEINYNLYDLVILDIQLPDGNGIDICHFIRKKYNLPIVFLTAHNHEDMIVAGLKAGADDYITKPFSLNVLYARIEVATRRMNKKVKIGELEIDSENYKVYKNNHLIQLTTIEYEILFMFIKHRGQVLTREQLYDCIERNTGNVVENNTLTVYMKRIRDKLGTYHNHYYIETIRGVGYRLYGNE
ncbi:MAG: response regulator transcription factor [Bacilli bacterium]|nr:response regulator transcription factor [Bacilli bacterium]